MMTNIVDSDLDTIKIGQKVKVVFKKTEGGTSDPGVHARVQRTTVTGGLISSASSESPAPMTEMS